MTPGGALQALSGRRVVFLSWRDLGNPEAGGAERYLHAMVEGLRDAGAQVTVFTAAYPGAAADATVDGVRYVRRGAKMSVYAPGMRALRRGDLGEVDLVVDVQNGLPFFSRLVTRAPVVVLVHHVHREQWPVVYPGLLGRLGWWLESRVAPRLFRGEQYVAVSGATREELVQLGVDRERIAVVHNGTDPVPGTVSGKSEHPTLAVVGRLVPHKQVEHAVDVTLAMRSAHPDVRLLVIGDGWWEDRLREYVAQRDATGVVSFEGFVDEQRKHQVYEQAWLLLLPSLKEGWGLVVSEAGLHETPTVAYRGAGGTTESVLDGTSGMLADDQADLTELTARLLGDTAERQRLGKGAREHGESYTWRHAQDAFGVVLAAALGGDTVSAEDPELR